MFTFTLALFAGHQYFSLYFRPLSAEREEGFGTKHSQRKPLTTCVRCTVSNRFVCFAAYFSSFPKEKLHFNILKETYEL